jgi:hypothetical protein
VKTLLLRILSWARGGAVLVWESLKSLIMLIEKARRVLRCVIQDGLACVRVDERRVMGCNGNNIKG